MKKLNGKLLAMCAAALLFYGCDKEEDGLESIRNDKQGTTEECDVIDFENRRAGNYVSQVSSAEGLITATVLNQARNSAGALTLDNRAMIFDSGNWTGDDDDLSGPWGNILIIQELGDEGAPNDNRWGGEMTLTFSEPVTLEEITVIDIDNGEDGHPLEDDSWIILYDVNGDEIDRFYLEPHGDGEAFVVDLGSTAGVASLRVILDGEGVVGSGAIDDIRFCIPREEEVTGCTRTQGYWKNHADPSRKQYDETWDEYLGDMFFSSGKTYLQVLNTPPKNGDAYYILAHQYIAAILNMESGASSTPEVDEAIDGAEAYFSGTATSRAQLLEWAELLDDYNNGANGVGPGHCDD